MLDLGLPDGDGLQILNFVRERNLDVGVVVLTARDESRDRVLGLDAGADDCVGKPFDLDELAARLRAVRRRLLGCSQPVLSHARGKLGPKSRLAWRGEGDLHLSRREFAIVEALDGTADLDPVAQPAGRAPLWLAGGHRVQRGPGSYPPSARQAGRRLHPPTMSLRMRLFAILALVTALVWGGAVAGVELKMPTRSTRAGQPLDGIRAHGVLADAP